MLSVQRLVLKTLHKAYQYRWKWLGIPEGLPTSIDPYVGFTNGKVLWLEGRVTTHFPYSTSKKDKRWRTLKNNVHRFGAKPVDGETVVFQFNHSTQRVGETLEPPGKYSTKTDAQGYFSLDLAFEIPLSSDLVVNDTLTITCYREAAPETLVSFPVMWPQTPATGVITDIDDTLLHSYVLSRGRIKMLYHTMAKSPWQRKPVEGAVAFFTSLHKQGCPLFYVSNSPWNIYSMLSTFLTEKGFPVGALWLRPLHINDPKERARLKMERMSRILQTYRDARFLLVGDSAEKDFYVYRELQTRYPDQVAGIFIRQVTSNKHIEKMQQIIDTSSMPDTCVFTSFQALLGRISNLFR